MDTGQNRRTSLGAASQLINTARTTDFLRLKKNSYKLKILFVCMGNICRSPTAEGVFRKSLVRALVLESNPAPFRF